MVSTLNSGSSVLPNLVFFGKILSQCLSPPWVSANRLGGNPATD